MTHPAGQRPERRLRHRKYVYVQFGGANAGVTSIAVAAGALAGTKPPRGPSSSATALHAAVTYDGTHYVVVTGNWLSGLHRYVEP